MERKDTWGLEDLPPQYQISEEHVLEAMKGLSGYLGIIPGDLREVFELAYAQAMRRLGISLRAYDLMSTPVVSVDQDTPLPQVARVMAQAGVSGLPVLDGQGRVLWVISEHDFLARMNPGRPASFMDVVARCLENRGCLATPMLRETAGQAMSASTQCLAPQATLAEIAALFSSGGINRAPVVDGQGRLLGIVSRADLVRQAGGCRP